MGREHAEPTAQIGDQHSGGEERKGLAEIGEGAFETPRHARQHHRLSRGPTFHFRPRCGWAAAAAQSRWTIPIRTAAASI
jgi:hypothetical protein